MRRFSILGIVLWAATASAQNEIGFVERFALASDRQAALTELVPDTDDYFFYQALVLQQNGRFDEVDALLRDWVQKLSRTARVREIENRQALLRYEGDPRASLESLISRLGVNFNHRPDSALRDRPLPSAVDASNLTPEAWLARGLDGNSNSLRSFETRGLELLAGVELTAARRRELLRRLERPDFPNLPRLIIDDMNASGGSSFGAIPIHQQLTLLQLERCLELRPTLLNEAIFVQTYLMKLAPGDDERARPTPQTRREHLERMEQFVARLGPAHVSLLAHVLFHRLSLDASKGVFDRDRFMRYVQIPRAATNVPREFIAREAGRVAVLNDDFSGQTTLPRVGDDWPLVRRYLLHFFGAGEAMEAYAPYVEERALRETFAEAQIVNGRGEARDWASWMTPERFRALQDRVDLEFAPGNVERFAPADPVALEVAVKNVKSLIVRVYEINTESHYRRTGREIDTDLDLDGLVANFERVHDYDEPATRRMTRRFEFPELNRRGVFTIEFIGGGKRSRALVRKGALHFIERSSVAGHAFTVFDENNEKVEGARIWMAGREFTAQPDGTVVIPYTREPKWETIALAAGDFADLGRFAHQAESYALEAGIYVDRESLLRGRRASALIRPALFVNGTRATVEAIEEPTLTIRSVDRDGVVATQTIPNFDLFDDRETVHEFTTPDALASLTIRLTGKVQAPSVGEPAQLGVEKAVTLNAVDATARVDDIHLIHANGEHSIAILGKNGEPKVGQALRVTFKHREYAETWGTGPMRTDADGRVELGRLERIEWIEARADNGLSRRWPLEADRRAGMNLIHGLAGEPILIPYMGDFERPTREGFTLLEKRGGAFVADRIAALSLSGGFLRVAGLAPGNYELTFKESGERIELAVTGGAVREGYAMSDRRKLEILNDAPLQVAAIETGAESIEIRLANAHAATRVHVYATRIAPAYSAFDSLASLTRRGPNHAQAPIWNSAYLSERRIGDEHQYIIDRQFAARFPGNMLARPELLLNPWEVASSQTSTQAPAEGEALGAAGGRGGGQASGSAEKAAVAAPSDQSNLDFLAEPALTLLNLRPDENGVVRIEREALGGRPYVRVLALDPVDAVYREFTTDEGETAPRDLRLSAGLGPELRAAERRGVTALQAGDTFTLDDLSTSEYEIYATLGDVYHLYQTLSGDPTLAEFRFIVDWAATEEAEKRKLYSKYASHELNYFLHRKDPAFFDRVVRPHLANKRDKTFVDLRLLGAELTDYARPWSFGRLNVAERVLLGQAIEAERERVARHVGDLVAMIPPTPDREDFYFKSALGRDALSRLPVSGMAWALYSDTVSERDAAVLGAAGEGYISRAERAGAPATAPLGARAAGRGGRGGGAALRSAVAEQPAAAGLPREEAERRMSELNFAMQRQSDLDLRDNLRAFYRELDKTKEWAENNYHHLPIAMQNAELIDANEFWRDYAERDGDAPFLSTHFTKPTGNFAEMMLALAALDLPFEKPEHEESTVEGRLTLRAAGPAIVVHKAIRPVESPAVTSAILLGERFFRVSDRYRDEGGVRRSVWVEDEFLLGEAYGAQIVVTNPTGEEKKTDLLLQIPQGALPIQNSRYTKGQSIQLGPFATQTFEYYFYFPAAGEFDRFPAHVSAEGELLARAEPTDMRAVAALSVVDTTSWSHVSQESEADEALAFLERENLEKIDLARMAWRLGDAEFFDRVIDVLKRRHVYDATTWSYAMRHDRPEAIETYLRHRDDFIAQCGAWIDTPILKIDPVERRALQHLEYKPLVNARSHKLGPNRRILNDRFHSQYHAMMNALAYKPALNDEDRLAAAHAMLLQDRIDEAIALFETVQADAVAERVQYDYLQAYVAFYREAPGLAREIADRHLTHPVDRWREMFAEIDRQVEEIEGATRSDLMDGAQDQQQLASTEPNFDFRIEGGRAIVESRNLDELHVNYYLMDLELLFSRNPFELASAERFSSIRPNAEETRRLFAGERTLTFDLPQEFRNRNVLVEIMAGGSRKSQVAFANALAVQVIENYGQTLVTHQTTGRPLARVYCKVYARMADGSTRFYKDGYTDLRGRFDYASLSTDELDRVTRFAILIADAERGSTIREAAPPKR